MSDRETFFPNDTPIIVFEARRPDIMRMDDPDGKPAQPLDVSVKIYNTTNGEFVLIDGFDTIELGPLLWLVPMVEAEDRGALIFFKISEDVSNLVGDYTLYITATYDNGLKITEDHKVRISEYR